MADSENVVPFPRRRDPRWDEIRSRLIHSGRLEKSQPPILASNLGRMADRLDPARPKDAARRMFEAAFGEQWEALWRKRQRLIRLPGEGAPPFERSGEYESGGGKYVHLAEAFARLRAANSLEERDNAIRSLTRGTIFNPVQAVAPGDLDGPGLAVNALNRLAKRLNGMGPFKRAFDILRTHPIWIENDELSFSQSSDPSIRQEYIVNHWNTLDDGVHWAIPRVQIGHLYFPLNTACVYLGSLISIESGVDNEDISSAMIKASKLYARADRSEDDKVNEFISRQALANSALKVLRNEMERSETEGLEIATEAFHGWDYDDEDARARHQASRYAQLYRTMARYEISICLWPSASTGEIEPRIVVSNDESLGGFFPDFVLEFGNQWVGLGRPTLIGEASDGEIEAQLIAFGGEAFAVPEEHVLSNMAASNRDGIHALDTDEAIDLLLVGADGERVFEPTLWDDRSRFAPAPQVSVVATILRNLAYANDEDRLDTLLLADAERRLKPVVQFYEAQRAAFDDALDQRD